ncbi:MAG TPA: radical SAM protein, partial [bacterium]|nr:radical SAM protein [bacterium]
MRNTEHDYRISLNSVLTMLDSTYLSTESLAQPQNCWIRVSTACNVVCPLCPRQHLEPVDSGNMPFDEFQRVASQMVGIERASLLGLGEAMLHRRFFDFVEECHARGMFVFTSTNGMVLNEEMCRRVVESGIEEFNISMDACTPELFNRLRLGADFEHICTNMKRLSRLRAESGGKLPFLFVSCTVSTENVHEFHTMVPFVHEMGFDSIIFLDFLAAKEHLAHYAVQNTEEF